jgi:hypothetical protein
LQVVLNILLVTSVFIMWARLKRPPQDDPRLSRGLQLLQSKITVLEDLSDRTDRQVTQLTSLIDQKARLLQSKIYEAETQILKVQGAMDKSLEVAEIFQDKIPHDEIIDRQNTVKYVRAARMAHSGHSIDEILHEVDLPREQVEFIAKVNREKLMFDDEQLPAWAQEKTAVDNLEFQLSDEDLIENVEKSADVRMRDQISNMNIDPEAFELPQKDYDSLKKLGEEFRQACLTFDKKEEAVIAAEKPRSEETQSHIYTAAKAVTQKLVQGVGELMTEPFHSSKQEPKVVVTQQQKLDKPVIKKVIFPRIDVDKT